jgi:hypothetical protein
LEVAANGLTLAAYQRDVKSIGEGLNNVFQEIPPEDRRANLVRVVTEYIVELVQAFAGAVYFDGLLVSACNTYLPAYVTVQSFP